MYYDYSNFEVKPEKPNKIRKIVRKGPWNEWVSWKTLSGFLDEYCREGSLHGLKYLRNPELSRVERLFWLSLFSIAMYFSVTRTWSLYQDMMDNPVELSYNPISTSLWDIPFPGIMICSANPVRKSFFNLNTSSNQSEFMRYSQVLCFNKAFFGRENTPGTIDERFFKFLNDAAFPCEKVFESCTWNGENMDCCSMFKPLISMRGLCFVFNSLPGNVLYKNFTPHFGHKEESKEQIHYWHISTGYPSRTEGTDRKTVLPLWSEHLGEQYGLTLKLMGNPEELQEECSGSSNEYNLHVLSPVKMTEYGKSLKLAYGLHTFIKLDPMLKTSDEDLRSVSVEQRGCLFEDEKELKYFNRYSGSSCFIECFLAYLLRECQCIPYDFHRFADAFKKKYCSHDKLQCIVQVMDKSSSLDLSTGLTRCYCLQLCSSLKYSFHTSTQPIVTSRTRPIWAKGYNKSVDADLTHVTVFFPQAQFSSLTRVKTASFSAFMGNMGGLLGMLLGFSFLSVFEIFYFALIKPIVRVIIFYYKKDKVSDEYYKRTFRH